MITKYTLLLSLAPRIAISMVGGQIQRPTSDDLDTRKANLLADVRCVCWNAVLSTWSSDSCTVSEVTEREVSCQCTTLGFCAAASVEQVNVTTNETMDALIPPLNIPDAVADVVTYFAVIAALVGCAIHITAFLGSLQRKGPGKKRSVPQIMMLNTCLVTFLVNLFFLLGTLKAVVRRILLCFGAHCLWYRINILANFWKVEVGTFEMWYDLDHDREAIIARAKPSLF